MTTIVCTACGFHNEADDQFCGGCQEYLEWTGEVLEDDTAEEPVDEEDEPHRRGLVERVVDTLTGEGRDDADGAGTTTAAASGGAAGAGAAAAAEAEAEAARRDESLRLAEEAAARARESAQQAERAKAEAEEEAREQARLAEQARTAAQEAERTKREAEEQARVEAEETEQLQQRLEEAREARRRAEEELSAETRAAEAAREDAASQAAEEEARTAREREEVAQRLAAEQEALEEARREVERAEEVRAAAEETARREAEAARAAKEAAEEAERGRAEAEAKAAKEAEEAERARRAAALVAPKRADPAPTTPAATPPAARPPTRRPRRKAARPTSTPEDAAAAEPADDPTAARRPTAPVKPAASGPRRKATTKEAPSRKLRPGDLVCGSCGEGNAPERNFCRRCGATLAESQVVKRPWYARWMPARRAAPKAGTRRERAPRQSGGAGRGARRVIRMALAVAALVAAFAMWRNAVLREDVFDRFGGAYERARALFDAGTPVTLASASASSQQDGHPAGDAIDRDVGTRWTEAVEGPGVGETITVVFDEPTTIVGVVVTGGDLDAFDAFPRPAQLNFTFDDGTTADMEITNDPTPQSQRLFARGVESVDVTVTGVHAGQGDADDLSITELEFRELG